VEARVQALLEADDRNPTVRIRPCDIQKLLNSLKLKKACGIDGIPNECTLLYITYINQFVPHRKHNTSPFCSQEL
jgi:hypothetical protein